METEVRSAATEETTASKQETVLPAARAEHVCAMAKAITESAPTAETLQNFRKVCEQTRTALNEALEAGEQGAAEAKGAIDLALIDLSRETLERQTGHVQEYESLSAALHAQADRQAALEILAGSVPLIEKEEKQDEVLTEAMAYCKLQQSEELTYSVDGVKTKLPVYKTTAEAAERVRAEFVDRYNHQPSRQRFAEELEDACKAEAEKEKIEKSSFRAASGAYCHEKRAYIKEHPETKKERNSILLKGMAFLLPALALLLCAVLFGLFKKDGRAVFAFVMLLLAGLIAGYLFSKKRLSSLYSAAAAECEPLKEAAGKLFEAKQRLKQQKASVRTAIKRYAEYRKTYLK